MKCIISATELPDFNPKFEVVSCFVEHDDKHLILERQGHKSEGGKWGPPAGKINANETPKEAIVREIFEETNLKIVPEAINQKEKFFVRYPEYDFIYYVFHSVLEVLPKVTIAPDEHSSFRWVDQNEALIMPLVLGQDEVVKRFYQIEI